MRGFSSFLCDKLSLIARKSQIDAMTRHAVLADENCKH